MMTRSDMHNLLVALDFTEDMVGGTWRRVFPAGVELCVDCTGGKFLYKEAGITVTTATTSANSDSLRCFKKQAANSGVPINTIFIT